MPWPNNRASGVTGRSAGNAIVQADRAEIKKLRADNERLQQSNNRLYTALHLFRSLVKEGGVPRYTITPGAALNSVIEETVDPVLRLSDE